MSSDGFLITPRRSYNPHRAKRRDPETMDFARFLARTFHARRRNPPTDRQKQTANYRGAFDPNQCLKITRDAARAPIPVAAPVPIPVAAAAAPDPAQVPAFIDPDLMMIDDAMNAEYGTKPIDMALFAQILADVRDVHDVPIAMPEFGIPPE